jgi:hypothetical protein
MRYQLDRLDGVESVNSEVVGGVEMRAKLGTSVNVCCGHDALFQAYDLT